MEVKTPPLNTSPETWAGMAPNMRALFFAAQECDTYKAQEEPKGSNRGPRVDEYQRAAGLTPGNNPWCACFVCWCLKQAGIKARPKAPAAVRNWKSWAIAQQRATTKPERGGLFYWVTADGTGHIGFVTQVFGESISSIEGNTNDEGSREGYEVARKTRTIASILKHGGFIDLDGIK